MAPANRRSVRRKFFDYARFAPDTVALRAEPLRPIVGAGNRDRKSDRDSAKKPCGKAEHSHLNRQRGKQTFTAASTGKPAREGLLWASERRSQVTIAPEDVNHRIQQQLQNSRRNDTANHRRGDALQYVRPALRRRRPH